MFHLTIISYTVQHLNPSSGNNPSRMTANTLPASPLRRVAGDTLRPGGLALTQRGLEACGFSPGARLLDLGCGPGASLGLLRELGYRTMGLDASPARLREAHTFAPCVRARLERIPLASGSLDGILCECVLSLTRNPAAALAECARVLRPGGKLLLSDLVAPACAEPERDSPQGPQALPALLALLAGQRFSPLLVEDHSRCLRELAARIVWEYGSLDAFAELCQLSNNTYPCDWPQTGAVGQKPGYILIVAQKENTP
jgi:SAM-dependent methyltransferase